MYHVSCTYLVKGDVSCFLHLIRKRRDAWMLKIFFNLCSYHAENNISSSYKDYLIDVHRLSRKGSAIFSD